MVGRRSVERAQLRITVEAPSVCAISAQAPEVRTFIERIETSTMPSVTGTLSASEVDDLIAYLFSLRKES